MNCMHIANEAAWLLERMEGGNKLVDVSRMGCIARHVDAPRWAANEDHRSYVASVIEPAVSALASQCDGMLRTVEPWPRHRQKCYAVARTAAGVTVRVTEISDKTIRIDVLGAAHASQRTSAT